MWTPGNLHLPPSLAQGADPGKLARQIAKHGKSLDGMPPLQVIRGRDGHLRINDGVTRATRAAKEQGAEAVEIKPDGTIRVIISDTRKDEAKPEPEKPKVRDFKL